MTSLYIKNGNRYSPTDKQNLVVEDQLPPGTYLLGYNLLEGRFYFEVKENFTLPEELYGDIASKAERIKKTFHDRENSTGLILAGEKGSGKTLLVKMLSLDLIKEGIVTIIVNQPFSGDSFNSLMQNISQPAYVLFDEFEKVYANADDQNALLTLFDGLFNSKKLFAVTCNDRWKMSEYMTNRPGRFFYALTYSGLDQSTIEEYLQKKLHNKQNIPGFLRYSSTFSAFNFDMLQSLVQEMNRFKETVLEASKWVNIINNSFSKNKYDISKFVPKNLLCDDDPAAVFDGYDSEVSGGGLVSPISKEIYITVKFASKHEDGTPNNYTEYFHFQPDEITEYSSDGRISYSSKECDLTIIKKEWDEFNYKSLL